MKSEKLKLALLCGGPSLERGISLNSARSVLDHLQSESIELIPIYFDHFKKPYLISTDQLYSNTPSDFDFKLAQSSKSLTDDGLKKILSKVDLAFPVMHGAFGEDGQIQSLLKKLNCPYVGSPAEACKIAFDKFKANEFIKENGFYTKPSTVLKSHLKDHKQVIERFFQAHQIKRAIVKPATGGSSIGVYSVSTVEEALSKSHEIFSKRIDTRVVVEPFCEGIEFTVIILENRFNLPVAILPTEIEIDYKNHQVFDYRKKYLATRQVTYHCPPRFDNQVVERIQIQAQQLFKLLGMRDFARFDGWLLKDGRIWFSDFNPISGMEQNSFLFQQSAQIGMSHGDLLRYIVKNACRREGIDYPQRPPRKRTNKKQVNVLFGGETTERQVSLMSGTNIWLKLRRSKKYEPVPFLLDKQGCVWKLPYSMTLNHTVEEIAEMCESAKENETRLKRLKTRVLDKLSAESGEINESIELPEKMTLEEFINRSERTFIGLHGGIGENGVLQKMLEEERVAFNGSSSKASNLCMNKYETGQKLKVLKNEGIYTAEKLIYATESYRNFSTKDFKSHWKMLQKELSAESVIVKPIGDGCSAGIARLFSSSDLGKYIKAALDKVGSIEEGTLKNQHGIIEMPPSGIETLMFERFVVTDKVRVVKNELKWDTVSNWTEITMGVLESEGKIKALNPSITVAFGNILTLEEKFQGGTGVNITPPPTEFVSKLAVNKAKKRMEKVADILGIEGYARIDAFMHVKTGELLIIEANSTPGLTPSTVIYHQALAENPAMKPTEFLEKIMENGERRLAKDSFGTKKIKVTGTQITKRSHQNENGLKAKARHN